MNTKTLGILSLIALLIIAGAVALQWQKPQHSAHTGELLLPTLKANLSKLDRIELANAADNPAITLIKQDSQWRLAQRGNYPIEVKILRTLLQALSQVEIDQTMTNKPNYHARLGLQALTEQDAPGVLLTAFTGEDKIAGVLFGNNPERGNLQATYVRREGEDQTWLVNGTVDWPLKPGRWLIKDIIDIPRSRQQSVTIRHADGDVVVAQRNNRAAKNFTVANVPADQTLTYPTIGNSLADAISTLQLEDVQPASEFDFTDKQPTKTQFQCFDGLVIEATSARIDKEYFVNFSARYDSNLAAQFLSTDEATDQPTNDSDKDNAATNNTDPASIAKEAAALNTRLKDWVFRIQPFKYQAMTKRMDDLLAKPEATTDTPTE